jgi:hypothetical protein
MGTRAIDQGTPQKIDLLGSAEKRNLRTDIEFPRHSDEYLHRSMPTSTDGNARPIQEAHFRVGNHLVGYVFERRIETIVDELVSNHVASLHFTKHIAFDGFNSQPGWDGPNPSHLA